MKRARGIALRILAVLLGLVVLAAAWLARPLAPGELVSRPDPARGYGAATARIDSVADDESHLDLQDAGRSIALLHGRATARAVVIFHGYTDVPDQFAAIARGYHDAGANVWVPRMPFHGYRDRMTTDLSKLTPELLRRTADANIDIAEGLGRTVEVVGLSGGGAMAAWAAAERRDVARSVLLSPLLLPRAYAPWMLRPVVRLVALLPDVTVWWNGTHAPGPGPEYPRYSRHGIAAYLMLAERAKADGTRGRRPVAGEVVIVSNLNDQHLDTQYPVDVMRRLVRRPGALRTVTIPASEGLLHDIVGLTGENRPKLRIAYRYLARAIGIPLPDPLADSLAAPRR